MARLSLQHDKITLGVQGVVTDAARRVLLVKHGYRPGWHFPGGGVEKAESVRTALARELEEEAGIVAGTPAQIFGIYSHFDAFPGDHIVLFVLRTWTQVRVPEPNREIAEHGFFLLDALPEGTTAQTRRRLEEIFFARTKAEAW